MSSDTVSVIIPTYNRAHCLGNAVDSVLTQTHAHVEAIIIDDGSTDGTSNLVASRYGSDERVRYIQQANGGVAAARNHGFRVARGDFVALLDSDDTWFPYKLELQLACLAAAPRAGMIWTDMKAIRADGTVEHERYLRVMYSAYRFFKTEDIFQESHPLGEIAPGLASQVGDRRLWVDDVFSPMAVGNLVHTSTVLLRRARREQVGEFDPKLQQAGEDYPFHLRTCRAGPVAFADIPTICYQRGTPDRLTRFSLPLARNFLNTLTETLRNDRERIVLPEGLIRTVLAEAHAWVGEGQLAAGARGEAIREFATSLRHRPRQPRIAGLLALATLPPSAADLLRRVYRRIKGAARQTSAA